MGLNIVLFDLSQSEPVRDRRFDSYHHSEDYAFVAWLNCKNAMYRLGGTTYSLDHFTEWLKRFGETIDRALAGDADGELIRNLYMGTVYERPKDFAAVRAWIRDHIEPHGAEWDRKRLLALMDLLESDENLWLYESW